MTPPVVICNHPEQRSASARLASVMGASLLFDVSPADLAEPEFALLFEATGLSLMATGPKAPGAVRADFVSGAVNHRRQFGGGKGQMIAKAVGVQARVKPLVLDATAGLGRDAFVLATLGCQVRLFERSPAVFALLADGLDRARQAQDPAVVAIVARMQLLEVDSRLSMASAEHSVDVVYLDPMFPQRQKSAEVKKEMKAFHSLVGADADADELLASALVAARYRVVVKRPRKAPDLANRAPSYRLEGKTSRYDIYTLKKLPDSLNDTQE